MALTWDRQELKDGDRFCQVIYHLGKPMFTMSYPYQTDGLKDVNAARGILLRRAQVLVELLNLTHEQDVQSMAQTFKIMEAF